MQATTMTQCSIRLICPGLLGPLPALPEPFPAVPTIDRLLARADQGRTPVMEPERVLLAAAGLSLHTDRDPPTAPICLLADDLDADFDRYWMHADPVWLRPDRDRLLVFAGPEVDPDRAEADALIALFNDHFEDRGLRLHAPRANRWYLEQRDGLDLIASPLRTVVGRSMGDVLPVGVDARRWMRLQNEAQMLFFGSAVNRAREARGRPPVSGIWTWGGGRLPEPTGDLPDLVVGDGPLAVGLARLTGAGLRPSDEWCQGDAARPCRTLVHWDALDRALQRRSLSDWADTLVDLDRCLRGLESLILRAGSARLEIDSCQGARWTVSRGGLRRFWRRAGLRRLLQSGSEAG